MRLITCASDNNHYLVTLLKKSDNFFNILTLQLYFLINYHQFNTKQLINILKINNLRGKTPRGTCVKL